MSVNIRQVLSSPLKFKMFLIRKLPLGFIVGLKMEQLEGDIAAVSLKYSYITQNPFRSIYFACLAMAAELASGSLSLLHVSASSVPVSMLVVHLEASFTKKAVGKVVFTCRDGALIKEAVEKAVKTGEGQTVIATSTGLDETGENVAQFKIIWSFKARGKK